MDQFTRLEMQALLGPRQGPCVSIFTTTQRGGSEDGLLRWKEQLHEAERQLRQLGPMAEVVETILRPARQYLSAEKENFWRRTSDGLATFLAPGFLRTYRLPARLADRVIVGQHFHIKPLLSWIGDNGKFFILAVSQKQVRLLEATAHSVRAMTAPNLPANMEEALRSHDRDEVLNYHTHHAGEGRGMEAVFHGQGVGIDDHKEELLRYFQIIDRALKPVLNGSNAPLVLATVEHQAAIYRRANHYPRLRDDFVRGNADRLSDRELQEHAWPLVAPLFHEPSERAVGRFEQLAGTGRATTELAQLLPALHRGEVETLLVAGGDAWGRYDPASERCEQLPAYRPGAEELVNLAVVQALRRGREVHVVGARESIGDAPLAGVYFAPMNKHGKTSRAKVSSAL